MTASELAEILAKLCAKAEFLEDKTYEEAETLSARSREWARIVQLKNLRNRCEEVLRIMEACDIEEF